MNEKTAKKPVNKPTMHLQGFPVPLRLRVVATAKIRGTTSAKLIEDIVTDWFTRQEASKRHPALADAPPQALPV